MIVNNKTSTGWIAVVFVLSVIAFIQISCESPTSPLLEKHKFSDTQIVTSWFDLSLELVKGTPGFTPPVASRAFGYLGVGFYESVVNGLPGRQSLGGRLSGLSSIPHPESEHEIFWPAAANAAIAKLNRELFRHTSEKLKSEIDNLENAFLDDLKLRASLDVIEQSILYGQFIADIIYEWSKSDGGHEGFLTNFPAEYELTAGPGMWIPTPPSYQKAMQPYWGNNRPFIVSVNEECVVEPPLPYSEDPTSQFYTQAFHVYQTVQSLTDEQRVIALFWADDPIVTSTPPGHWVSILNQVLLSYDHDFDMAAISYARLGMALADAFIACWDAKYIYNLIRPLSYIQQVIDENWNYPQITDPVITPPFPEYPSGHSVQSGAAAEVLTSLFGDISFVDKTHENRGFPSRTYNNFWEAAEEAAISRLYGGIHYMAGIEYGVLHGRCIGQKVNTISL